jgi:ankyrin repeat protein
MLRVSTLVILFALLTTLVGCSKDTRLTYALRSDDLETVKVLLATGVDVNEKDKTHETPLMVAAARARPEIVSLLLEHGADTDAKNDVGGTPTSMPPITVASRMRSCL